MTALHRSKPGVDPGLTRRGRGRGARFHGADGRRITGRAAIARIHALAISPAWTQVWIAVDPDAHIQATGRDARGRLQYIYHPGWKADRAAAKYGRLRRAGPSRR